MRLRSIRDHNDKSSREVDSSSDTFKKNEIFITSTNVQNRYVLSTPPKDKSIKKKNRSLRPATSLGHRSLTPLLYNKNKITRRSQSPLFSNDNQPTIDRPLSTIPERIYFHSPVPSNRSNSSNNDYDNYILNDYTLDTNLNHETNTVNKNTKRIPKLRNLIGDVLNEETLKAFSRNFLNNPSMKSFSTSYNRIYRPKLPSINGPLSPTFDPPNPKCFETQDKNQIPIKDLYPNFFNRHKKSDINEKIIRAQQRKKELEDQKFNSLYAMMLKRDELIRQKELTDQLRRKFMKWLTICYLASFADFFSFNVVVMSRQIYTRNQFIIHNVVLIQNFIRSNQARRYLKRVVKSIIVIKRYLIIYLKKRRENRKQILSQYIFNFLTVFKKQNILLHATHKFIHRCKIAQKFIRRRTELRKSRLKILKIIFEKIEIFILKEYNRRRRETTKIFKFGSNGKYTFKLTIPGRTELINKMSTDRRNQLITEFFNYHRKKRLFEVLIAINQSRQNEHIFQLTMVDMKDFYVDNGRSISQQIGKIQSGLIKKVPYVEDIWNNEFYKVVTGYYEFIFQSLTVKYKYRQKV